MRVSRTIPGAITLFSGICLFAGSLFAAMQALAQTADPALVGAIDVHAHLDPDGFGPGNNGRGYDVFEMAELAKAAGMRGFVIKQH